MDRPLEGVRVLDLTRLLPGAFATQLLVDLGAEVIKVEEPGRGDYMRSAPPIQGGLSLSFLMMNQGKKSIALNLKEAEGRDIFLKLLQKADVLVEQFRPGVTERLGIDYRRVSELNRTIIYCSLSGFGQTGPDRDRPAHDLNFQALAGILYMSSSFGRPVVPATPAADLMSGALAANAIIAALLRLQRAGVGSHIDLSMLEAAFQLNMLNVAESLAGNEPRPGGTYLTGLLPSYGVYETADGAYISLAALEEKFWREFCRLVGRSDLAEFDPMGPGTDDRIREELEDLFRERTLKEWEETLAGSEVPYAPVVSVDEALDGDQVRALGILQEGMVPGMEVRTLSHPIRWSPAGPRRSGRAPALGEHTMSVLSEVGIAERTIRDMARRGVLGIDG